MKHGTAVCGIHLRSSVWVQLGAAYSSTVMYLVPYSNPWMLLPRLDSGAWTYSRVWGYKQAGSIPQFGLEDHLPPGRSEGWQATSGTKRLLAGKTGVLEELAFRDRASITVEDKAISAETTIRSRVEVFKQEALEEQVRVLWAEKNTLV